MDPLEIVQNLISISDDVKNTLEDSERLEQYCNLEQNDLVHALEFNRFNAYEGYKLAKQLQECREKRREAKEMVEILEPLYRLINKHQSFFRELKNVEQGIKNTINVQNQRQYQPRVRDDLFKKMAE